MIGRTPGLLGVAFPPPSPVVVSCLDELRLAAVAPPESDCDLRRLLALPRPWDPPTCPGELRRLVYVWLDDVVAWVNEEHTWRTDHVIPICWVEHPHIVHELATVACLRWEAGCAVTPGPLEDWHRYTLPMFLERIAQRIGTTGCPPGRHQPSPGEGRQALYRDGDERAQRCRQRNRDSELEAAGNAVRREVVAGPDERPGTHFASGSGSGPPCA